MINDDDDDEEEDDDEMDAATASEFQNFIAEPEEDVSRKEKMKDGRNFSVLFSFTFRKKTPMRTINRVKRISNEFQQRTEIFVSFSFR